MSPGVGEWDNVWVALTNLRVASPPPKPCAACWISSRVQTWPSTLSCPLVKDSGPNEAIAVLWWWWWLGAGARRTGKGGGVDWCAGLELTLLDDLLRLLLLVLLQPGSLLSLSGLARQFVLDVLEPFLSCARAVVRVRWCVRV